MEYMPPLLPGERLPDEDSPKKRSRWSVFELFKRRDDESVENKKPAEAKPERAVEGPKDNPDRLRSLAQKFMKLIGAEPKAERSPNGPEAQQPETAYQTTPEKPPTIVERAKQIGRNVLGLVKQTKSEVHLADEQEHVPIPTNTEPLEVADQNVRAAMEELLAPIDEYVAERSAQVPEAGEFTVVRDEPPAAPQAEDRGYDYDGPSPEMAWRQHDQEVGRMVAAASHEAVRSAERQEKRKSQVRKLGVVAAVGALVYTWHRQKKIVKEQRDQKRKLKKFEAEVRQEQEVAAVKIAQLERTQVSGMNQPARQEYVQEVSQFATRQAQEIRNVARAQHPETELRLRLQRKLEPIIAGPGREVQPVTAPKLESLQTRPATPESPTTRLTPEKAPLNPAVAARAERPGIVERVAGVIAGKSRPAPEGGSSGSTGGSTFVSGLRNIVTGNQTAQATPKAAPQITVPTPIKNYGRPTWLLGILLAGAVILTLLFLTGVL